jgi:hypothetical protein
MVSIKQHIREQHWLDKQRFEEVRKHNLFGDPSITPSVHWCRLTVRALGISEMSAEGMFGEST